MRIYQYLGSDIWGMPIYGYVYFPLIKKVY
jgi:hypothetical protein